MNYASHNRRPNPAALAGALGIPAAFGALLVVGLAVTVVTRKPPPPLQGFTFTPTPIPPPPPDNPTTPKSATTSKTTSTTVINRPDTTAFDFATAPVNTLPGIEDLGGVDVGPVDFGIPGPGPSASPFDPVGAVPRNNPARWVLDSDYRSTWLRQGLSGSARFTLTIDAAGKVAGCSITRSTGHGVLDAATCELVSKRARFDAARDGSGKPVAGSYSGAITWNIPD
ncbi:MAG: energy transducer TonB [Erythrobacter sp.]